MMSWMNYANLLGCHAKLFLGYTFFKALWNITVPTCVSPASNFTIHCLLISLVLIIKKQLHQQICFHQSKVLIIIYYH